MKKRITLLAMVVLIMTCLSSCAYQHYKSHLFKPDRSVRVKCPGQIGHGNYAQSMKYYYKHR